MNALKSKFLKYTHKEEHGVSHPNYPEIDFCYITVPAISPDNIYPVKKTEKNTHTLYFYIIDPSFTDRLDDQEYKYQKPRHFLTFSNLKLKTELDDLINKLSDKLVIGNYTGIFKHRLPENMKVNFFVSDSGINIMEYIDSVLTA